MKTSSAPRKAAFTANKVGLVEDKDLNFRAVVIAEKTDGSGRRLELQRSLHFDESDRELGMDTYCICTDTGATHYGGLRSWKLDDGSLSLHFSAAAARTLRLPPMLKIDLPARRPSALAAALQRVLEPD